MIQKPRWSFACSYGLANIVIKGYMMLIDFGRTNWSLRLTVIRRTFRILKKIDKFGLILTLRRVD